MEVKTQYPAKFLAVRDVARRYAISPETVRKLIRCGKFPKPTKIGSSSRWAIATLDKHDASRFAETDQPPQI